MEKINVSIIFEMANSFLLIKQDNNMTESEKAQAGLLWKDEPYRLNRSASRS